MSRSDLENWNNKRFYIEYNWTIDMMINRMKGINVENKLIIPEYQRDYVWKESEVPKLLTSLYKGYPIGSIVIWDEKDNSEHYLIDGLQRHWTLLKIHEKTFNFITYNMYVYWAEKNKILLDINDKERFRHLNSFVNHKRNNYISKSKEEVIKWISTSTAQSLNWTPESRNNFIKFIEDFEKWKKDTFLKINVPHYILDGFDDDAVADVFGIINSTGKQLTKFEIISAKWSRHKIFLDKNVEFIEDFLKQRKEKYKKQFLNSKTSVNDKMLGFNAEEIIPSNLLYSLFLEALKEDEIFKDTFLSKDGKNYIIKEKAIEPLAEILMHILKVEYNEEVTFDNLGHSLKNILNNKDVIASKELIKILNLIKKYFLKTKKSIKVINLIKDNSKKAGVSYSTWLIASFVIHNINAKSLSETKYHPYWFIRELFFEHSFDAGSGNKARELISKLEFNKEYEKREQLFDRLFNYLSETEFDDKEYNNKEKIVALSIFQDENMSYSIEYEIDHLIPKSIPCEEDVNIDSIFNLQLLPAFENREKSDNFTNEQLKYDKFNHEANSIKSLNNIFEKMYIENEKGEKINSNDFNKYLDIRKKAFEQKIQLLKNKYKI